MKDFEIFLTAKYKALTQYEGDVAFDVEYKNPSKRDTIYKLYPFSEEAKYPPIIVKVFEKESPYQAEKAALVALEADAAVINLLQAEKYDDHYCLFLPYKGDDFTTFRPLEPKIEIERELTERQAAELKVAYKHSKLKYFVDDVKTLLKQLISGLKRMAAKGIVHGDVKGGNVLLHEDTLDVTIIDFESSCKKMGGKLKRFDGESFDPEKSVSAPQYRAPEKTLPSFKGDVWAAGLVGLFLLVGEHFLKLRSDKEIKAQQQDEFGPFQIEKGQSVIDVATRFLDHISPRIAKNLDADVKDKAFYIPITEEDITSHSGFLQIAIVLVQMLQTDPAKRSTAEKASTGFFKPPALTEEITPDVALAPVPMH